MDTRTYLDSSVIINALRENDARMKRAQAILEDPARLVSLYEAAL